MRMRKMAAIVMVALFSGCVAPDSGQHRSASQAPELKEPSQMDNPPVTIAWDFRNDSTGKQLTSLTYAVPETYVGKTLRILFVADFRGSSGVWTSWFMPEDVVHITGSKGSLSFDDYLTAALIGLNIGEGAKGLGTFRVALYETADPSGDRSVYGSHITYGSTCLLGSKAKSAYKEQVSNMLTIQRQSVF